MRSRLVLVVGLFALYGSLSCSEDPARVGRPPVVEGFSPSNQDLDVFTGDTLDFSISAVDPDHAALSLQFVMGDSVVATGTGWEYVVADTGNVLIRCVVSDGEYESSIRWNLNRRLRVNYPPFIKTFFPVESSPTMVIGTQLAFAVEAIDDDRDVLEYSFSVDGQEVAKKDRYVFDATEEGGFAVEARVTDGELISKHLWNLTVTGVPDTIPPAEVVITDLQAGTEPGEVDVAWIAVGQNGMEGQASNYLVRTSPAPVLTEEDWQRASEISGVPDPVPPGETMSMTITGMIPGRYTRVTVRAVDDFGNLSPVGESPGVYTKGMYISGIVRNALTLEPVPNMAIGLTSLLTTTDANGEFEFTELPPLEGALTMTDEDVVGDIGEYFDYVGSYEVVHNDYLQLYMLPNIPLVNTTWYEYTNFYVLYRVMTDLEGIPPASQQRRWNLPINIYIPPFVRNGLDYRQTILNILPEFDAILGTQVFNVVDSIPDLGVSTKFDDGADADNYLVTDRDANFYPVKGRVRLRTVYTADSAPQFKIVVRHEFGHVIGLQHSRDPYHLMVGGTVPRVSNFTPDEISVMKVFYNIPRGTPMTNYRQE
jgi:hypothetical protein